MSELSVLDHRVLTKMVELFPVKDLAGLSRIPREPAAAGIAEWDEVKNSRHLADFTTPGAEAKTTALRTVTHQIANLAYIREKKMLSAPTMYWLRRPGSDQVQFAEGGVRAELADLNNLVDRRVEWMIWKMLSGNLAVSQNDIKFSIDYGIVSSHKPTVTTSWANPAADVLADLTTWKKLIARDSGEVADTLFLTETVMGYLVENQKVRDLLAYQGGRELLESGRLPHLLGLDLVVYDAGYVPEGGSFTPFIPDDHVVMTAGKDFWALIEGASLDVRAQGRPGKFAKSWEEEDPSIRQILVEWAVLPVLKKPDNAVYAAVAV